MNEASIEELEKSKNKYLRDFLLMKQKHTKRNVAENHLVNKIQIQEEIGHLFNLYARLERIENAKITFTIKDGRFNPYEVYMERTGGLTIVRP